MTIDPFGGGIATGGCGAGAHPTPKGRWRPMLWALRLNRERLAELPTAVDFVAFMGEESGQWGSKEFVQRHGGDYGFGWWASLRRCRWST